MCAVILELPVKLFSHPFFLVEMAWEEGVQAPFSYLLTCTIALWNMWNNCNTGPTFHKLHFYAIINATSVMHKDKARMRSSHTIRGGDVEKRYLSSFLELEFKIFVTSRKFYFRQKCEFPSLFPLYEVTYYGKPLFISILKKYFILFINKVHLDTVHAFALCVQ